MVIDGGGSGSLHVPGTEAGGVFVGEQGWGGEQINMVVLDDGSLYGLGADGCAVDHDRRLIWLESVRSQKVNLNLIEPSALFVPYTAERRSAQQSNLVFWGHETNVRERKLGNDIYDFYDDGIHFDGSRSEIPLEHVEQPRTAYDFDWLLMDGRRNSVIHEVFPVPGTKDRYRLFILERYGLKQGRTETHYLQMHVSDYWLDGQWDIGMYTPVPGAASKHPTSELYQYEVTEVQEYTHPQWVDDDGNTHTDTQTVLSTRCRVWVRFAQWTINDPSYPAPQPGTEGYHPPGEPDWQTPTSSSPNAQIGWYTRGADLPVATLRDILDIAPPEMPEPSGLRFSAAGGAVTVWGPRTVRQANLAESKLTAWGHTFEGGTWAALRDLPRRNKDGTLDFDTVIVLHASDTTVTAIRSDGSSETCSRAEFEMHVLRVPAGNFRGFNSVGSLNHSWPPEWAWANCAGETRAIVAHDVWRDSYKVKPRDSPNPPEWYWPARPARRPKALPTVPRGLLGLTLADVTGTVTHDEQLKKGEGPLRVPISATQTRADGAVIDVTRKVAKRLPYSPAHIPDERDDRTFVTGTFTVTFGPLPEVR